MDDKVAKPVIPMDDAASENGSAAQPLQHGVTEGVTTEHAVTRGQSFEDAECTPHGNERRCVPSSATERVRVLWHVCVVQPQS
eukprot:414477-Pleurochrysis_carterae.AAC.1